MSRVSLLALLAPVALCARVALVGTLVASCKPGGARRAADVASPVAAPESLFGEGTLRDPDAFWARLRGGAGGALMSMPDTAAGVVIQRARLDPRLAHLVAGGLPFHVALGEAEGGGLAFAVAMKLRDLNAARAALVAWDAGLPPGATSGDEVKGLTPIGARGDQGASLPAALSSSGYLVVASSATDLTTLGPYAARTVPTKPLSSPSSSLELRAAPGALAQAGVKATNLGAWATSLVVSAGHRLLPSAFDTSAFAACINPTLRAEAAMIADLADARIDIDTGDGELHAVATLTPKPGDSTARARLVAMHPADAAPLLDAPGDATYAWFVSDTPAQRDEDARAIAPCVARALVGTLGEGGSRAIGEILSSFAKGRGDWDTLAFVSTASAEGLVLRAPIADADAASRSMGSLVDLVRQPPASEAVQEVFGVQAAVVEHPDVPSVGSATVVSFARPSASGATSRSKGDKRPTAPAGSPPLGLGWVADSKEIDLGAGLSPRELLTSARQTRKLGDDLATAQAVRALGADASFAVVLKPFGCCTNGGATATPLTFGWGRRGDAGWSRLEIGDDLLLRIVGH